MNRFFALLLRFAPPFIWMGLIFWLSSQSTLPGAEIIWWDFILKKTAHLFVFGVLFYWWMQSLRAGQSLKQSLRPFSRPMIVSLLLSTLYAVFDEIHQSFTPGRHPRYYDVLFDVSGMLTMYLIMTRKFAYQRKKTIHE